MPSNLLPSLHPALADPATRFRLLVQGVTDYAIFLLDPQGMVVSWNAGAQQLIGYAESEIVGRHFSTFSTEEDRRDDLPTQALQIAGETGRYEMQGWRVRRDGSRFWAHVVIDAIRHEGELVGFAKITRDQTAQRQTEEALRQSQATLQRLIDGVVDYAIYMLDADGRIVTWNTGAQRIKGYAATEILGQHVATFYTPEDQQAGVPAQVLATAAAQGRFEAESWRVRQDGSRFLAHVVIDAIHEPDGRLAGFAKVTRDITEQRLVADRLRHAEKMEAIGNLTGGLAHDFNNLLAIIIGNLDMAEEDPALGPDTRELVIGAREAGLRGAELTNSLLAFARRQPLAPKRAVVNDLVAGLSRLLDRTLGEEIEVRLQMDPSLWPVVVDAGQLEAALTNLATNARDAMPGGGRLTIATRNDHLDEEYARLHAEVTPGDYVLLEITDTGTGMPPEIVEKAFEPFFTTKEVGQGTGLGLSMVFGFVKQSGGHVKIYSEVGHGTSVKIYLPRATEAAPQAPAPRPADVPRARAGEVILAVEDNAKLRDVLLRQLMGLGYEVLEAEDGPAALAIVQSDARIDLLLTDVVMPGGLNGVELAREATAVRPDLRVLFTSGFPDVTSGGKDLLAEGDVLLRKPYRRQELAQRVREVLD